MPTTVSARISGYRREELIGQYPSSAFGVHPPEFFASMWDTITSGQVWQGEVCNRARDGQLVLGHKRLDRAAARQGRPAASSTSESVPTSPTASGWKRRTVGAARPGRRPDRNHSAAGLHEGQRGPLPAPQPCLRDFFGATREQLLGRPCTTTCCQAPTPALHVGQGAEACSPRRCADL